MSDNVESSPLPIPKGAYNFDFDNLDDMDPFQSKKQLGNSPNGSNNNNKPADILKDNFDPLQNSPQVVNNNGGESPVEIYNDNESVPKTSPSTQKVKVTPKKSPAKKSPAKIKADSPNLLQTTTSGAANESSPLQIPKGGYNFDFDNLDDMDPFQSKQQLGNSPNGSNNNNKPADVLKDNFDPLQNSPQIVNNSGGESPVEITNDVSSVPKTSPNSQKVKVTPKKSPAKKSPAKIKADSPNLLQTTTSDAANESSPLPIPKGGYNFDFDNLDEMDPFQSKQQLGNSPNQDKPADILNDNFDPLQNSPQIVNNNGGESPVEINNENESVLKTSPNTQKIKVTPKKSPAKKSPAKIKADSPKLLETTTSDAANESSPLPIPKGGYNFDFDNLDDMDPFQSKKQLGNSPNGSNNNNKPADILKDNFDPLQNSPQVVNNSDGESPVEINNDNESVPKTSPNTQKIKGKSPAKGKRSPKQASDVHLEESTGKSGDLKEPDSPKETDDTLCDRLEADQASAQSPPVSASKKSQKSNLRKPKSASKSKISKKVISDSAADTLCDPPSAGDPLSAGNTSSTLPDYNDEDPSFLIRSSASEEITTDNQVINTSSSQPTNLLQKDDDDGNLSTDDDVAFHDAQQDIGDLPAEMNVSADIKLAEKLTQSLDAVHEFGAGENEMPEENEGFVPATDIFTDSANWDMLEKMGGGSKQTLLLGRESLYVAFDPFVKPIRPAADVIPEKEETTPVKTAASNALNDTDLLLLNTPSPSKLKSRATTHPAARKLQDQFEEKKAESIHDVDRLLLSTSPIITQDKDENMANNEQVVQIVQVMKYSQTEWNKMKQELELTYQAQILNKEKEWSKKLADTQKKLSHSDDKLRKSQQTNEDMRAVVAEFEKTIAQLQAEQQKSCQNSKSSLQDIMKERDQALEDLNSVETAFSDLHRRFEKAKGVVESFKQNENALKKCVEEHQGKVKKAEAKLHALKQQAEEKLEQVHTDMERLKKSSSTELAKLEAAIKKSEIQIKGLEQSLAQKKKENEELTNICDELISKVS